MLLLYKASRLGQAYRTDKTDLLYPLGNATNVCISLINKASRLGQAYRTDKTDLLYPLGNATNVCISFINEANHTAIKSD